MFIIDSYNTVEYSILCQGKDRGKDSGRVLYGVLSTRHYYSTLQYARRTIRTYVLVYAVRTVRMHQSPSTCRLSRRAARATISKIKKFSLQKSQPWGRTEWKKSQNY